MKNLYRIIIWSIICLISLSLGIVGLLQNNRMVNMASDELNKITETFNKNQNVLSYQNSNIIINASLKKNKITINFNDLYYIYTYNNDFLTTNYYIDDNNALSITEILYDTIMKLNSDTYQTFPSELTTLSLNKNKIEFIKKNNKYYVTIKIK